MLDRALAERKAQGLDVAVRQREIDGQIEELRKLEERLDEIPPGAVGSTCGER